MIHPRSTLRRSTHARRAGSLAAGLSLCAASLAACSDVGRSAAASAPADTTAGAVSFRLAGAGGAAIVVPAYINGRGPIDLILDTGATVTCLDSTLVRELALPRRRATIGTTVGVGGAGRVQLVQMDSLRVGEARAEELTACSLDLGALRLVGRDVRGLLGLNFLRSFRMTLDFERRTLHLTRPQDGRPSGSGALRRGAT
jgi:predicted aspartyl protease